jgi:hypothetical protein
MSQLDNPLKLLGITDTNTQALSQLWIQYVAP